MKHRPRKRFGQNFLVDQSVIDRIVDAISPQPGDHLVEVGPGRGALTRQLAGSGAQLTLIEIDRDLSAALAADPALSEVRLINADVLKVNWQDLARGRPIRLVGNLPYNISTPLLFHALASADLITDMHFMLQQEVVQRMAAPPGSKAFGRLSVMLQYRCRVESLFRVPPGAFRPVPKVGSAVVRLRPRSEDQCQARNEALLDQVVSAAFAQRRKTLRNSLRSLLSADQITQLDIDPSARPETLEVTDFVTLADALADQSPD